MTLFDSHTHVYLPEFDEDRASVLERASESGIVGMMLPNVDCTTVESMKRLHASYPAATYMAIGLHPTEVGERWTDNIADIKAELDSGTDYKAIGEIGIDLYWDKTYLKEQMDVFSMQVSWAVKYGLPVIIHCREGLDQVLEVLSGFKGQVSGVFHSFGGDTDDIKRIRDCGDFLFGINGIVTFKNSRLKNVIPEIGLRRVLLETDAPYLAPVPFRGKRNEPSYMIETAKVVASALNIELEAVGAATTKNAYELFKI